MWTSSESWVAGRAVFVLASQSCDPVTIAQQWCGGANCAWLQCWPARSTVECDGSGQPAAGTAAGCSVQCAV